MSRRDCCNPKLKHCECAPLAYLHCYRAFLIQIEMRFQQKKVTENVRGILGQHLDGTEKEFREATQKIVLLIKSEHIAKEHFRKQRDNCLIALQDRKDFGY